MEARPARRHGEALGIARAELVTKVQQGCATLRGDAFGVPSLLNQLLSS